MEGRIDNNGNQEKGKKEKETLRSEFGVNRGREKRPLSFCAEDSCHCPQSHPAVAFRLSQPPLQISGCVSLFPDTTFETHRSCNAYPDGLRTVRPQCPWLRLPHMLEPRAVAHP